MKLRSEISLALVHQGYLRGSKEFRNAYSRELRRKNPEREKEKWKAYYKRKQIETNGEWNNSRLNEWRLANPGKWAEVMKRAADNGLHRRFYEKHRERIKTEKRDKAACKRREHPLFGIWADIRSGNPKRVDLAVKRLEHVIDGVD